jgi:hypothetical protein
MPSIVRTVLPSSASLPRSNAAAHSNSVKSAR